MKRNDSAAGSATEKGYVVLLSVSAKIQKVSPDNGVVSLVMDKPNNRGSGESITQRKSFRAAKGIQG